MVLDLWAFWLIAQFGTSGFVLEMGFELPLNGVIDPKKVEFGLCFFCCKTRLHQGYVKL